MSNRYFDTPIFHSVTDIVVAGTDALDQGEMLMVENFTLQDSMSAVEMMDPRMDSGMKMPDWPDKPFDPLIALLPEEVCWILDRAMACEMTWHQGYTLTQTVYTCRYVHHANKLSLEGTKPTNPLSESLRQIVLRAGIYGMLKCCDVTWRELSKGNVIDTEDWNSEKADVSLLESVQLPRVVEMLQNAILWLETSSDIAKDAWKERLKNRLQLRLSLLYILSEVSSDLRTHIEMSRAILKRLISHSQSRLCPAKPIAGAFDRTIVKDLPSFLPLPPIECFTIDETFNFALRLVESRSITLSLESSDSLLEWKVTSSLHSYKGSGRSVDLPSFTRSRAMSAFCTDDKILCRHPPSWIVDTFFSEYGNVPPSCMFEVAQLAQGQLMPLHTQALKQIDHFEQEISKLLLYYYSSYFYSRSRQRRQFANTLVDWQRAFAESEDILRILRRTSVFVPALERIPLVIQYNRLDLVREVIFSGFELELYSPHEVAFIYWYATGVLNTQCDIIDALLVSMQQHQAESTHSSQYLTLESSLAKGVALLCQAFARLIGIMPVQTNLPPERQQSTLLRRFKWSFGPGYDNLNSHDPATPDFEGFELWQEGVQMESEPMSEITTLLTQAQDHLVIVMGSKPHVAPFKLCGAERKKVLQSLFDVCEGWRRDILLDQAITFEKLSWSSHGCFWFPSLIT